jgi:phosphoribosylformylglycinamidine cyclo-ligase
LILSLLTDFAIDAMSHITGGGLLENITRSLPAELGIHLNLSSWPQPSVFQWLQGEHDPSGIRVEKSEMLRTFNCGIGFVLIVAEQQSAALLAELHRRGERAWEIGEVVPFDQFAGQTRVAFSD